MPTAIMTSSTGEPDASDVAHEAGLIYVSDSQPGIKRIAHRDGFRYVYPDGRPVRDAGDLARIKSLAIPPAYTDVWICKSKNGHIQATGRDARGRKQYRYHPKWRETRDDAKYGRLVAFGCALPQIRRRVANDLSQPGLPRTKVLAALVQMLECTLIRVGNEEYAKANKSYGLTTMQTKHVEVTGATIHFCFRGKSGKAHRIDLTDRKLANVVKRCLDLPGRELFDFIADDGTVQHIGSGDVNDYLREASGENFTAKDFRTWAGTVLAANVLRRLGPPESERAGKQQVVTAIEEVAARLGNTPAICRKCYVHPCIIDAYLDGDLTRARWTRPRQSHVAREYGLTPDEAAVHAFLRHRSGK